MNSTSSNFAKQPDKDAVIRLVINIQKKSPIVFNVSQQFSWQSLDLCLRMFSSNVRSLVWEFDDLIEFVNICSFFMVNEPFVNVQFGATVPPFFLSFFFTQN